MAQSLNGAELMRAAVLGSPVAHSLSPALHTAAYRQLGLTGWRYDRVELVEDALPSFLDELGADWAGLSLTMPLKQAVIPLLDEISPLAAALGVVNTVTFSPSVVGAAGGVAGLGAGPGAGTDLQDPSVRARRGDNTDVAGIERALRAAGVAHAGTAVVLGAGATAASAVAALRALGCEQVLVCARSQARATTVLQAGDRLGVKVSVRVLHQAAAAVAGADVVVSTVPAGGLDALAASLRPGRPGAVLLDVVYDPWPTVLAATWAAAGGRVVTGVEMLLHQAAEQVRLMTGRAPDLGAMRAALPATAAHVR